MSGRAIFGPLFPLLLAGLPAPAQELVFSADATETCLAGAATTPEREACIGRAAQLCIDAPGGYTTVGMGRCLGQELDYWDGRLNAAYGALMAQERALAEEMREIGARVPDAPAALRDMQRAWIVFRDAACAYEHATWGGGTGGGPATAGCLMELTGRQALALEARLSDRAR